MFWDLKVFVFALLTYYYSSLKCKLTDANATSVVDHRAGGALTLVGSYGVDTLPVVAGFWAQLSAFIYILTHVVSPIQLGACRTYTLKQSLQFSLCKNI